MHPLTHGGRRAHARLAILLGALAMALAHAAPAHAAGTYIHTGCVTGADLVDAYGGWQAGGYLVTGNNNGNNCSWGGGLHTEMYPGVGIPLGATVGWTYTAPPHTSISRFVSEYAGWTKVYDNVNQGVIEVVDGAGRIGLWYTDGRATVSSHGRVDWSLVPSTNAIAARVVCNGPDGHPGCSGSVGWFSLFVPKLYLADDMPPTVGAPAGSVTTDTTLKGAEGLSYSASDLGGGLARLRLYVDGQATVDHVIDANNGHCQITGSEGGAWAFSWPKPCPGSVNAQETIDTKAIADGQHTLTFKVVDVAQREATVWTGSRLVANHPPVNTQLPLYADQDPAVNPVVGHVISVSSDGTWTGPNLNVSRSWVQCDGHGTIASCSAIPGATGLSYTPTAADVGHRLRLAVTATNPADSVTVYSSPTGIVTAPSSAEPITPKPDSGKDGDDGKDGSNGANGAPAGSIAPVLPGVSVNSTVAHTFRGRIAGEPAGATCPQDRATLKFEHVRGGQKTLGFGKASTVQVQLTCTTSGKAIGGAQLDIATRVGTRAAVAADVTTDGAGHATLRLAKGAGRSVTVGYRMYADDPIARATATLKVVVRGKVSLKANRKHLRNGQAVTLRGRLIGGEVPTRGVTLAVQWKDGRRWRPFAQIKTNRKGSFAYAYKFTRTRGRIVYALRVQVTKGQVDYPYLATASKAVKVIVAR